MPHRGHFWDMASLKGLRVSGRLMNGYLLRRCSRADDVAPEIDGDEQEQPNHVDEVPVPGGGFESEMALGREMALHRADPADEQEHRPDENVEAVKSRGHEESGG